MATKQPDGEDLGLNMTPMIDIVFQLIVFFMLNLRFKAMDERIDTSMPKEFGIDARPIIAPTIQRIRVALFRADATEPAAARTKIRVGGREWVLPAGDQLDAERRAPTYAAERAQVLAGVEAHIKALLATGIEEGEIDTPRPTGTLVPHADVVSVLDAFLGAGCTQVRFEGTMDPLPRRR